MKVHLIDGEQIESTRRRVVVLSRDKSLWANGGDTGGRLEYVLASSGYEAAAEILAAPAMALVIDLRMFRPRQLPLLDVARRAGLEMLAVGALSAAMTAEDLSGVRLVARSLLAEALASVAVASPLRRHDEPSQEQPPRAPADQAQPPAIATPAEIAPQPVHPVTEADSPTGPIGDLPTDPQSLLDEIAAQAIAGINSSPPEPARRRHQQPTASPERVATDITITDADPVDFAPTQAPADETKDKTDNASPDLPVADGLLTPEEIAALLGTKP